MELKLQKISQPLLLREKLEIIYGDDENAGKYITRIEDFLNGDIVVDSPKFIGGDKLLHNNAEVKVYITKEDAAYQFFSVIEKIQINNISGYILHISSDIERVQRRRFARVEIFEEVLVSKLPEITKQNKISFGFLDWKTSVTQNISGAGVLIRSEQQIIKNNLILLNFGLFPELNLPKIIAGICRRSEIKNESYLCGVEFIESGNLGKFIKQPLLKCLPASIKNFDTRIQNSLVNYLFQQQIKLRQKGLI